MSMMDDVLLTIGLLLCVLLTEDVCRFEVQNMGIHWEEAWRTSLVWIPVFAYKSQ